MNLLMIFIDGFGLGEPEHNPIVEAKTPALNKLLGGHFLWGNRFFENGMTKLWPLNATLEIEGIPQSATGQTTLWTGINAAKLLGHHLKAFPNERLWQSIQEYGLFSQLSKRGKKVTFANAYLNPVDPEPFHNGKKRYSASTLMTLAAGLKFRDQEDLLAGKAVFHDITNESAHERMSAIPVIAPEKAGAHLASLVFDHDFTLFEFFQTDVKGHKHLWAETVNLVERIDRFVGGFLEASQGRDIGLILTSDHGNIEDFRIKGHTLNPVPMLCFSNRPVTWPEWKRLEDVTPGIVKLLTSS